MPKDNPPAENLIAISPSQLRGAMRVKWLTIAGVAALTALCVAGALWVLTSNTIVNTVRHDVKRASVFNCNRTNRAASAGQAVRDFLTSDAKLNEALGAFDQQTSRANADLSREIRKLGDLIPMGISVAYARLSRLYDQIAALRVRAARLWAGPPHTSHGKAAQSLSAQVLLVSQAPCDKIISP